jgi:molecular chaperone HscB
MNYFEVFGLPRCLAVDGGALQQRFYELSRQYHPDFHQGAPADEQARVLTMSALVNAAYRTLRDPIRRVEYLIRLEEGRDTREGAEAKPRAPRELLEEMMEIQEALLEAKAGGLDDETRPRLEAERRRLVEWREREELSIVGRFAEWDRAAPGDRSALLEWFTARLAARAYLRTVIDDLGEALGEDTDTHVSHRRH